MELKLTQRQLDSERTKQRVHDRVAAERDKVERNMRQRMMAETIDLEVGTRVTCMANITAKSREDLNIQIFYTNVAQSVPFSVV